jgi:hypothetical protein
MAYLQGLSLVDQVLVRSATAGSVRFSLALNAAPEYLQQSLQAGKTLTLSEKEGVYLLQP